MSCKTCARLVQVSSLCASLVRRRVILFYFIADKVARLSAIKLN